MANNTIYTTIKLRSDTSSNFISANPVLKQGEPAFETDTNKIRVGDGQTAYNNLPYLTGDMASYMSKAVYAGTKSGYVAKAETADKLTNAIKINGVDFDGSANITISDSTKISATEKGVAGGVATLDSQGFVPSSQLPSYVDDVIEGYYYNSAFYKEASHSTLIAGETGKIYVDVTNKVIYRYTGTTYVSISNPLDIATQSEATAGTNDTKAMTPKKTKDAIVANIPTALPPNGTAGGDLTGSYPNPTIANGKITDAKIAAGALSTSKLFVPLGDILILDGGDSTT